MTTKNIKIIFSVSIIIIMTFLFVKCNRLPIGKKEATGNTPQLNSKERNIIVRKLSEMTLREKIAQMVISSVVPENLDEGSAEFNKNKKALH